MAASVQVVEDSEQANFLYLLGIEANQVRVLLTDVWRQLCQMHEVLSAIGRCIYAKPKYRQGRSDSLTTAVTDDKTVLVHLCTLCV